MPDIHPKIILCFKIYNQNLKIEDDNPRQFDQV